MMVQLYPLKIVIDKQMDLYQLVIFLRKNISQILKYIKATYIEIDQVEQTYPYILFSPTSIFGAEISFNCWK